MGGWGWNLSYKKVSDPRSACHCIKYSSHSLSFGGSLGTLGLVKQEWRGQEAPFHLLNQLGSEWRLQRASGWLDSLRGRSVKKLQEDLMLFKSAKTKIHLIMLLEGCGVQWPVTHFDLQGKTKIQGQGWVWTTSQWTLLAGKCSPVCKGTGKYTAKF